MGFLPRDPLFRDDTKGGARPPLETPAYPPVSLFDGGKIILQKAVEVQPGDTAEVLQRRVMEQAEWILLPQAAELLSAQIAQEKENRA